MRLYLYLLEIYRGKSRPNELRIIYAVDEEDAQNKAKERTTDCPGAEIMLKRWEGHFTVSHNNTYPAYIDMEETIGAQFIASTS